jgi:DNA-binding transcriptional LysR family regulator
MPLGAGIELRHLRYFLAVYEELHFGRAAARLHMAQPPLSQAIRKLEDELGVELFVRSSRAVKPTAAGTVLAEEARRAIASVEFAIAEARQVGLGERPLRVGCLTFLPTNRLEQFLSELKQHNGELRTEVTHLVSREQIERLRSGSLDLGVLISSQDYPDLDYEPMLPSGGVVALIPNGHRLAEKQVLTPDDLAFESLVFFPRSANPALYDGVLGMLEDGGYRFAERHEGSSDPRDILLAVEGGLGIAFIQEAFAGIADGRPVVVRPIDPQLVLPDVIVAWRTNAPRRLRALLPAVRDIARGLYAGAAAAS